MNLFKDKVVVLVSNITSLNNDHNDHLKIKTTALEIWLQKLKNFPIISGVSLNALSNISNWICHC